MFIHFGLYSMLGGVWNGKQISNGYSEQIMSHAPIPLDQYTPLARQFNPVKLDADAIVQLAQQAGMKYIVITAKHHDGFNMFRTRLTTSASWRICSLILPGRSFRWAQERYPHVSV